MTINLTPWRERRTVRRIIQYSLFFLIGAIVIIMVTISIHYYLNFLKNNYRLQNIHLAQLIATITVSEKDQKLADKYQITTLQIKLIKTIQQNQLNFWREFSFLQHQLPKEIQLTGLSWAEQGLSLQGTTSQSEHIGLLVQLLEKSRLFSLVILETINKEDQSAAIHFTIHADRLQELSV